MTFGLRSLRLSSSVVLIALRLVVFRLRVCIDLVTILQYQTFDTLLASTNLNDCFHQTLLLMKVLCLGNEDFNDTKSISVDT